jgi:hypothetical protein
MSRYRFFEDVYNEEIKHIQKGFVRNDLKEMFKSKDDVIFEITNEYKYRPDKIAYKFYQNPKLYWILVYVNNIKNSPEGFEVGTYIRVPSARTVENIL